MNLYKDNWADLCPQDSICIDDYDQGNSPMKLEWEFMFRFSRFRDYLFNWSIKIGNMEATNRGRK